MIQTLLQSGDAQAVMLTIEIRLGYIFLDRGLLVQSLTRKAAAQEKRQQGKVCEDQEVFRTLGDAVLKAILTELLIQQGCTTRCDITQKQAKLENAEGLIKILRTMEIRRCWIEV